MFRKLGKKGFTITEMSLALVMGGMLMGGVLKGETLMDGFKVQALMHDLQNINIAYCMYFNRYNSIPGDDSDTHGWVGVTAGNRNGFIDGSSEKDGNEAHEAWQSLRLSGYITGNPAAVGRNSLPQDPYGGRYQLGHTNFGGSVGTRNYIRVHRLAGSIAEMIDEKLDDGVYNTGSIKASSSYEKGSVDLYYAMWL